MYLSDGFHEFSKVHVAMRFKTPENWKVSELNDLVFDTENVAWQDGRTYVRALNFVTHFL